MTNVKKEDEVTIDPVTTAPGVLGDRGLIPVGTRLPNLPVDQFSDKWMKAVTKIDQGKVKSHRTRVAAAKQADQGPTVDDAMAQIAALKETLHSISGKVTMLQQQIAGKAPQKKPTAAKSPATQKQADTKPAGDTGTGDKAPSKD